MKKVICDVCGMDCSRCGMGRHINVEILDGEHPHNGSTMHRNIDVCEDCLFKLPSLRCDVELDDLKVKRCMQV